MKRLILLPSISYKSELCQCSLVPVVPRTYYRGSREHSGILRSIPQPSIETTYDFGKIEPHTKLQEEFIHRLGFEKLVDIARVCDGLAHDLEIVYKAKLAKMFENEYLSCVEHYNEFGREVKIECLSPSGVSSSHDGRLQDPVVFLS